MFACTGRFARNAVAQVGATGATGVFGPPSRLRKRVFGLNARPNTSHVFVITDKDNYVIDVESGAIVYEQPDAFTIAMVGDTWSGIEPMAAFAADGAMSAVTNAEKEVSLLDSSRNYATIATLACRDSVMATVLGENKAVVMSTNQCVTWDMRSLSRPLFSRDIPPMNIMPLSLEFAGDTLVFHLGSSADSYAVHFVPLDPESGPILYDSQIIPLAGLFDGGNTVVREAITGYGYTSVWTYTDTAIENQRIENRRVKINDFWSDRAFRHRDGTLYVCGYSGIARVSPSPEWTVEIVSREELDRYSFLIAMVDRTFVVANNANGVHNMDVADLSPMLRKFNVL